ncbi:hypothetical protein MAPG_10601 [Magnaporthiopsis poae ATCC 64411]|uniref:Uncharacterized protein n=1 Tax=Magnaporthiopsis poae (strain ATCC 64411 / 73-15) TaxID=644358 RepID=A0A0C4ED10_MAGP6|nr:hypothetical protein MAPG_10601 [Magnaporthiopsis poae ATCC 64411]
MITLLNMGASRKPTHHTRERLRADQARPVPMACRADPGQDIQTWVPRLHPRPRQPTAQTAGAPLSTTTVAQPQAYATGGPAKLINSRVTLWTVHSCRPRGPPNDQQPATAVAGGPWPKNGASALASTLRALLVP